MKCLYEVLGVARDADDETIRKVYRKQALVWHPDKNQNRKEEAEERFKEIQNAYEILSDKHERAWYDNHRDAILRSDQQYQGGGSFSGDFSGSSARPRDVNLYQFFSNRCYNGYHDGPKGFYFVYAEVFSKLAAMEVDAYRQRSVQEDLRELDDFPEFGNSETEWKSVQAFYASWLNFTTVQDFAWMDEYHTGTAPNRKVRRLMEEENKKLRKLAKREFTESVRQLASFVKKRDKRVTKYQKEEAAKREAREQQEAERRRKEQEDRLRRAQEFKEADWIVNSETPSSDEDCEAGHNTDEQEIWCVVCDKRFRSAKALSNHERSRKHQELVEELKEALKREEGLGEDALLRDDVEMDASQSNGQHGLEQDGARPSKKGKKKKKKRAKEQNRQDKEAAMPTTGTQSDGAGKMDQEWGPMRRSRVPSEVKDDADGEALPLKADCRGSEAHEAGAAEASGAEHTVEGTHKDQAGGHHNATDEEGCTSVSDQDDAADLDEDELLSRLVLSQSGHSRKGRSQAGEVVSGAHGSGNSPEMDECISSQVKPMLSTCRQAENDEGDDEWGMKGKKKGRQGRRQKSSAPEPKTQEKGDRRRKGRDPGSSADGVGQRASGVHVCSTCSQTFPSRNQLFKHIAKTKHAALTQSF